MQNNPYELFNDIEDQELRTRNRAVIMGNITEQFLTKKGVRKEGHTRLSEYFGLVPEAERASVFERYLEQLKTVGINVELIKRVAA